MRAAARFTGMWHAFVLLALLVAAPSVAAAEPLEIDILEDYLATGDAVPGTPHCARTHGYAFVPGQGPVRVAPDTNRILREHIEFHVQAHDGPSGFAPSPSDDDRYGEIFLEWHEYYVGLYQRWRAAQGHAPLAAWNPADPMPASLAYAYPQRNCSDGRDDDPGIPLPTWATLEGGDEADPIFGHQRLCDFADTNQLGKSLAGAAWHRPFHAGVGGDMRSLHGPRDPAFWAGHQFLIELTQTFVERCGGPETSAQPVPVSAAVERDVPTSGLAAVAATVGAAFAVARRTR